MDKWRKADLKSKETGSGITNEDLDSLDPEQRKNRMNFQG